jgi:exonuclease SbcC
MKLLRIEVENLNSLYGKHVVELEQQFGAEPLFLITGPTGAGKSTLMDAVSLALFGRTPRLAQGRGQDEQDPRLILSRGTGKGGAVLEFSRLEAGLVARYRATWTVRRARDKAEGTPQPVERTLERQDPRGQWQVLVASTQAKQFQPHFDRVLAGMNVDDFQRSVLLAQGQFAAFLQATEEERAKILERLTGTGHYLAIGQRASVKKREHEAAVQQAQAQLDAVQSLSADDEQRLTDERERLQAEVQSGQQALQREQQALTWLQQADTLAHQLADAEVGLATALQAQADAGPQLAQLAEHERCAVAADTLRTVDELTGQQASLQALWVEQAETVATQTAAVAAAEPVAQAQQEVLNQQRQAADGLRPEIGKARALYAQLRTEQQKSKDADAASQRANQQAQEAEQMLAARRKDQAQQAAALQLAQEQLQLAQDAAPLVTAAAGLHQQHTQVLDQHKALQARQQQIGQRQRQLATDRAGHTAKTTERQTLADQLAPKRADQAAAAAALTAALAGAADPASRRAALRAQRETLQQQALSATQALEFHQKVELLGQQHKGAAAGLQVLQQAQEVTAAGQQEATAQLQALQAPQQARLAERKALQLLRDLVQERAQLQTEQPCPLCGSPDHPYVESGRLADAEAHAVSRCAALDIELDEAERQVQTLQARLQTLALEEARQSQQVQQHTRDAERLQAELTIARAALATLLQRLALPADSDAAALRETHTTAAAEQLACSRAEQALDQAEAGHRRPTDALQAAELAVAALDQALAVQDGPAGPATARTDRSGWRTRSKRSRPCTSNCKRLLASWVDLALRGHSSCNRWMKSSCWPRPCRPLASVLRATLPHGRPCNRPQPQRLRQPLQPTRPPCGPRQRQRRQRPRPGPPRLSKEPCKRCKPSASRSCKAAIRKWSKQSWTQRYKVLNNGPRRPPRPCKRPATNCCRPKPNTRRQQSAWLPWPASCKPSRPLWPQPCSSCSCLTVSRCANGCCHKRC